MVPLKINQKVAKAMNTFHEGIGKEASWHFVDIRMCKKWTTGNFASELGAVPPK